uniref:Uncharacterized protein n=1 Tax=viral metagenome TaxID=1070528 RepID=A0A6M3LJJ3_9ZZZZ
MYKNIGDEEIVGKTVKGIYYGYTDTALMIVFDDETFAVFHASTETTWGETDHYMSSIIRDGIDWLDTHFSDDTWTESGVLTEEELVALRAEKRTRLKRQREEKRRKHYEQLRSEFGEDQS